MDFQVLFSPVALMDGSLVWSLETWNAFHAGSQLLRVIGMEQNDRFYYVSVSRRSPSAPKQITGSIFIKKFGG